jgi:hypothetical protein
MPHGIDGQGYEDGKGKLKDKARARRGMEYMKSESYKKWKEKHVGKGPRGRGKMSYGPKQDIHK